MYVSTHLDMSIYFFPLGINNSIFSKVDHYFLYIRMYVNSIMLLFLTTLTFLFKVVSVHRATEEVLHVS